VYMVLKVKQLTISTNIWKTREHASTVAYVSPFLIHGGDATLILLILAETWLAAHQVSTACVATASCVKKAGSCNSP